MQNFMYCMCILIVFTWLEVRNFVTLSGLTEGGESHNGDDDSSESDGDEPSLSQEPKVPRNPSTGGSQPGSAVHRPRGAQHTNVLATFTVLC